MAVDPVPISVDDQGATVNVEDAMSFWAFFGTADSTSPTAANVAKTITTESDVEELFKGGPLCEVAKASIGYSRQGGVAIRLEEDVAGAYGAIVLNDSDYPFTGTAVPTADATAIPINDFEIAVEFVAGGTLGTTGITWRYSLDGVDAAGNLRSVVGRTRQLGTSSLITLREEGSEAIAARFELLPAAAQVTALIALVTELRADRLLHYALGATTHNSADVTSGVAIGAVPTTLALAIARLNQIRTADLLHAANAVAHNSADITSLVGLPAACTDAPTAIALAIFLKTSTNTHNADATAHDTADAANDITAASPVNGIIATGDRFTCPTSAPTFDAAALTAAFDALKAYVANVFTTIVIRGQILPAHWTALLNGRALLATGQYGRPTTIICETRLPATGETDSVFRAALDLEWDGLETAVGAVEVYRCANYGRYDPADIAQLRGKYRRTQLVPFAARCQALDYGESPALVAATVRSAGPRPSAFGGRLLGFRLYELGGLIGHNERFQPGLHEAGFGVLTTYAEKPPLDVYVYIPNNAAPAGNLAPMFRQRRVIVALVLQIKSTGIDVVGTVPAFEPGRTTLRSDIADKIDALLNDAVARSVGARASEFRFAIDRNATISLQDAVLPWTATAKIAGEIVSLPGTLAVNKVA